MQVHQTKKANKFECKLCGEKQSIKRHYGVGTAAECRIHVQKLNGIRGEIDGLKETTSESDDDFANKPDDVQPNIETLRPKKSKWSNFVEKSPDTPDVEPSVTMFLNNTEVVLEVPRKVRNLGKRSNFKCPTILKPSNSNHCEDNSERSTKVEMDCSTRNASLSFSRQFRVTNENANSIKSTESSPIKIVSTKNQEDRRAPKKFVPPVVNCSKWAQFVAAEVESENQDDFNDTSETVEGENNDNFTSKDNSTEDLEQYEKFNFYMKNTKPSAFINSHVTNQESQLKKKKDLNIYVLPTFIKRSSKWAKDTSESTENIVDNVRSSITANSLFALCEDSEFDEILDI